jgi:hypothetical protein
MCEYHDISGAQSRQRFPVNALVAQSRIAYQTAPLLRHEIRPRLFVFAGAGGAVTAVAGVEAVVLRTIKGRILPLIAANLPLPRSLPSHRPRSWTRSGAPATSPGRASPESSSLASACPKCPAALLLGLAFQA